VSGTAGYQPFAQSAPLYTLGIFEEKNPNLQPEFSQAEDLGGDLRLPNGAVFSMDLQDTTVHNVFQQLTLAENTTFQGNTGVLGIFLPINVAQLRSQLITAKYAYAPSYGFGYNFQVAADRSILSGIPSGAYNANPGFPVNNVQVCGNGLFTPGLATCIPFLKGYGQISYSNEIHGGTYAALGIAYWGKNNPYYQPPFTLLDLTVRQPLERYVDLQFSVENLLNSNTFSNLPEPNAGVPVVAETTTGQTTYLPDLLPAPPRTFRLQARFHMGR
jgi:outer membrane receptor protein involved in Fe transport